MRKSGIIRQGFTTASTSLQLILLAPLLASLADGFIASHCIGEIALDAVSGILPFVVFTTLAMNIFGMGPTVQAGKALGGGNMRKADQYWTLSLCSVSILSLTLIAFATIFGESFISSVSVNEEERLQISEYFYPMVFYLVINAFCSTFNSYIIAEGFPRIISFATTLANIVNISLDILFMWYLDMGIEGAAYASVWCALTNLLIVFPHLFRKTFPFHIVKPSWESVNLVRSDLSMWAALNIGGICISGYESLCNMLIAKSVSVAELAIWSVSIYILNFCFTVFGSYNYAYQYINSLFAGQEDSNGMKETARKYWISTIITGSILCALIFLMHAPLIRIFGVESYHGTLIQDMPLFVTLAFLMVLATLYPYTEIALSHGHPQYKIMLYCSLWLGCPLIMWLIVSAFGSEYIWFSLPLTGLVQTISVFCLIFYNKTRNTLINPFLFSRKVPDYVSMEYSVPFSKSGIPALLDQIRTFVSVNEASKSMTHAIELCCEEIVYNTISLPGRKGDHFDMRFVSLPDSMKLIIMYLGKPFSPVLSPQKLSRLASDPEPISEADLRLEIVNSFCHEIFYRYAYGINIVELRFKLSDDI